MKKIIFLSLLFICLAGCGHKQNFVNVLPESVSEITKPSETMSTGKIYTHIYQDLGIKITTSPLSTTGDVLKRNKNIIYNGQSPAMWQDYMEVFPKNPNISFEDEIRKNHLSSGCIIQTGIIGKTDGFFSSMEGFHIIYITSKDGNLASNGEIFDKQFPENNFSIAFVMDPKRSDRYYKFSYGDCAPGPCSIFGKIEFL